VEEFLEPARREAPGVARQQCSHPAARAPLLHHTGQVVGPRTEARTVDGVAADSAAAPARVAAAVAEAAHMSGVAAAAVAEPAHMPAAVVEPARVAVERGTTNLRLPFVVAR
jgi:hypothetical protein